MATQDWQDKVAVVTGASTGIGLALARALAAEGMNVVMVSSNKERIEQAAASLGDTGRRVLAIACDVTDRAQVRALADRVTREFGGTDLLCANAGATSAGEFIDHKDEDWDWALDIGLHSITNCVQAFYPQMAKRGSGTILLTGSQTSLVPDWVKGHGPYVAAKAGVLALAFALRAEAAEHGVKVSLLMPAGTATDVSLHARQVPPGKGEMTVWEGLPSMDPDWPFMISPEEVAARAVSGLKDDAPLITTHPGMRPLVEDYFARILSAYDRAAAWRPAAS